MNYYVSYKSDLPLPNSTYISKLNKIPDDIVDKLIYMYQVDKLTLEQIEAKTGIEWWTVKEILKKHNIERLSVSDRAKLKRAKDFDLIYKLHFIDELSIKEIYQKYKFSPPYVRQVLKDKGYKPINRGQFNKKS